jgi:Flp pilus assembly protein TadG
MKKFVPFYKQKTYGSRAQAIVEFAIVLPILLAILIGILEFSRMIFIYSAVTNASRNAVRYASAVGLEDGGTFHKYLYCHGIYEAAKNSAFLVSENDLTVTISYHDELSTSPITTCTDSEMKTPPYFEKSVDVSTGDRVRVTVSVDYRPMVRLIPIPEQPIEASSYRTILGIIDVDE